MNRISKISLLFLSLIFISLGNINAQATAEQVNLTPTYTAENEGWLVNLDEAYQLSKKSGKPILANFTGSDWCGWCKRLTKDVFVHQEFKDWAAKNVILVELDFPRGKFIPENIRAQNSSIAGVLQISGYPTIFVFNLNKDETNNQYSIETLGKTGYASSVQQFTSSVDQMIKR